MSSDIKDRVNFSFVRYANVWEDADILCEALQPTSNQKFLSISSSGDNCFSLLAEGASVVAVDLNASQLAATNLKKIAIRNLDHLELLRFLGINRAEEEERVKIYQKIKNELDSGARTFWDSKSDAIKTGFIHDGKFERYFQLFRKKILPIIHSQSKIDELFKSKSEDHRCSFYNQQWNSILWKGLFKVFFSRFILGRFGRDPEFFKYVEGSVSKRLLARTEYAFTRLDPSINPFLKYILLGNFVTEDITEEDLQNNTLYAQSLPRYLRPTILPKLKTNLNQLQLFQGSIEDIAAEHGKFNGFNLSDLFEYLSEDACEKIYGVLLENSLPNARLAYWNMLVARRCPEKFRSKVNELKELGDSLLLKDQAFFYSAFKVDEVK